MDKISLIFYHVPMVYRRPTWIPVVTGLIKKGNCVLIGQRPEGHSLAGLWEFPGGKIESNESPPQALARELEEELGIDADIGPIQLAESHDYGDVAILLLFYEVLFWRGEPKTVHHNALRWVQPQELWNMNIPEANRKILDKLIAIIEA